MDPETAGSCWTWTSAVLPCCHLLKEEGAMMSANTHTHTVHRYILHVFALFFSSPPSLPVPLTHANAIYLHHLNGFLVTLCRMERAFAWHHTHKHCNKKKIKHSFILLRHWQGHVLAELLRKENPKAKQKGKKWKDSCLVPFFFLSDTSVYFYLFDFSHD